MGANRNVHDVMCLLNPAFNRHNVVHVTVRFPSGTPCHHKLASFFNYFLRSSNRISVKLSYSYLKINPKWRSYIETKKEVFFSNNKFFVFVPSKCEIPLFQYFKSLIANVLEKCTCGVSLCLLHNCHSIPMTGDVIC